MIKLEDVHKAMSDPYVQAAAKELHFNYMLVGLDGAEHDPARMREMIVARFDAYVRLNLVEYTPTEEHWLATERLLQTKIETGQAWTQ
jgi:hypothetical protein